VPGLPGHSAGQHGDERARNSPGRTGTANEMAGVCAFLASDDGATSPDRRSSSTAA
jgi:hypothetical protein